MMLMMMMMVMVMVMMVVVVMMNKVHICWFPVYIHLFVSLF